MLGRPPLCSGLTVTRCNSLTLTLQVPSSSIRHLDRRTFNRDTVSIQESRASLSHIPTGREASRRVIHQDSKSPAPLVRSTQTLQGWRDHSEPLVENL